MPPAKHRPSASRLAMIAFIGAAFPALSQTFQPKAIQFEGAPEYSSQELLSATGLQPGTVLAYAEMNSQAQKLVDTGIFSSVSFKFDGQNLVFQLTPAAE